MVTSGCTGGKQPVLMNVLASQGGSSKSLATEQRWRDGEGHRCHGKEEGELRDRFMMASSSELIEIEGGKPPPINVSTNEELRRLN